MKNLVLTSVMLLVIGQFVFSQNIPNDSLYLGQTPPGDSAIVFGAGTICLPDRRETKIVFSPNEQECLMGVGMNNTFKILYTDFYSGCWKTAVPAYFINNGRPIEPFYTPDSLHVFFTSYADIYRSTDTNQIWQTPVMLASPVNSAYEEYHPATSLNGTLYFCSMRENPNGFLYRSVLENGAYPTLEKLDIAINRHDSDQNGAYDPFIAPDESYLIFSSVKTGGYGQDDQYVSYYKNGRWTNPKNLGPSINTDAIEYGSYVSPDGKYYFFSRPAGWGPNAAADIYWIKIDDLIDSLSNTNFIPYVRNLVPWQNAFVGQLFTYTIPDSTFFDDDGINTLTYDASLSDGDPLPGWLTFDSLTASFSGFPPAIGILNIRVTAADFAGATTFTTFNLTITTPSSIDQKNGQINSFRIFPNPSSGMLKIVSDELTGKSVQLEIRDITGNLILEDSFISDTQKDLSSKPKGVYTIILKTDDRVVTSLICIR
ncbi:MAG: PD40 domain-containing protein [Bacteroidetes bacterium]|nr:PD40 domain-containing protein [Bacteroidota bacterium]